MLARINLRNLITSSIPCILLRRGLIVALSIGTHNGFFAVRRWAALLLCSLIFLMGYLGLPEPVRAAGNFDSFCVNHGYTNYSRCHNQTFRKIIWSRVKREPLNSQGCTSAYNGNGVVVGGWVCTTTGLQATNYYDGSKFLQGLNQSGVAFYITLSGNEEY